MNSKKNICHQDIANLLNITQSTVSRALDPDPVRSNLVSVKTKIKVQEAAKTLGFCTNIHARRTRTHSSEAITLIIDHLNGKPEGAFLDFNAFSQQLNFDIISGVIDGAAELGFEVKLLPLHSKKELDVSFLRRHLQFPYSDGIVFLGFCQLFNFSELLKELDVPQIMIANAKIQNVKIPQIYPGIMSGTYEAVKKLLAAGCRHPVFQALNLADCHVYYQFERLNAWKSAFAELAPEVEFTVVEACNKKEVLKLAQDIAKNRQFDAVLAANDGAAGIWCEELQRLGVKIPEEIKLVGFDGNSFYEEFASVAINYYKMGFEGAKEVVLAVKENKTVQSQEIPTTLKFV